MNIATDTLLAILEDDEQYGEFIESLCCEHGSATKQCATRICLLSLDYRINQKVAYDASRNEG